MKMVRFSIIVPVYQAERYLERLINSILAQDYKQYEMILVDDGSTDRSGNICDEFSKRYPQIKTIHKKNGGVSSARNEGIRNSRGEYILFADADDYYDSSFLKDISHILEEKPKDICVCGYYRDTDKEQEKILSELNGIYTQKTLSNVFSEFVLEDSFNSVWNKVFRADIIKMNHIEFPNQKIAEDGVFVCRYIQESNVFCFVNEAYYHYCQNEYSAVHRFSETRWEDELNYLRKLQKCVESLASVQSNKIMGIKYRNAILFDLYNLRESSQSIIRCTGILRAHLQSVYNLIDWNSRTSGRLLKLQLLLLRRYRTLELIVLMRIRKKIKCKKKCNFQMIVV